MVGRRLRNDAPGHCFTYVHRLDIGPIARIEVFLSHEAIRPDQPMTLLSKGGDKVHQARAGYRQIGESILDWSHIAMRIQNLIRLAKIPRSRHWRLTRKGLALLSAAASLREEIFPALYAQACV